MNDDSDATTINAIIEGDCRSVLQEFPVDYFSACITDPPYNYEFVGRDWNSEEIDRRIARVKDSKTLVKNLPYGSGLAGGVRNERWYRRVRENILEYQQWCTEWGQLVYDKLRPGGFVLVFNSTRTIAHVQVALEQVGFYARDVLVYRRNAGIPKGLNAARKLESIGDPESVLWEGWHSCLRNEWEAIAVLQKPLVGNYLKTIQQHKIGLMHAEMNGKGFLSNILEGFTKKPADEIDGHCTVKPLALMKFLVDLVVPNNDTHVVLDPFAGTGTTCLATRDAGHGYVGIEINPEYVAIANKRLERTHALQQTLFT